jgi:hypothetical protein
MGGVRESTGWKAAEKNGVGSEICVIILNLFCLLEGE